MAKANETVNEAVSAIRVIRSFNTEKHEARRYDDHLMEIRVLVARRDAATAIYLLARRVRRMLKFVKLIVCFFLPLVITFFNSVSLHVQLTGLGMQVVMLYYGRKFIQSGQMTTGDLVSFILYQSDLGDDIRVT